jgi:SNF2 family DNA or RNA helicase
VERLTLRDYQVDAVRILKDGGINASGLGAGKTLMSVMAAATLKLGRKPRILVICPPTVTGQWKGTFELQFPSLRDGGVRILGTHRKDLEGWAELTARKKTNGVYIIGWNAMYGGVPDGVRRDASRGQNAQRKNPKVTQASVKLAIKQGTVPPWTRAGTFDLVIIDEAHRALNTSGVPWNVLKVIKADRKLALSGTPAGSKPENLWGLLNLVWPREYSNRWDWINRYFHVTQDQVSDTRTITVIGEEIIPGKLWDDIPAVVRVKTEDVVDMPPVIDRQCVIPMAPEQARQYREFEEQCLAWLGDQPVGVSLDIEKRSRLRQIALGTALGAGYKLVDRKIMGIDPETGIISARKEKVEVPDVQYDPDAEQPKIDAIKEILADLPDGEPLLVWTNSATWARMAAEKLGSKAVSWSMKTTKARREKIKATFGREGGPRILVAQLQSLAEGVDWLKDVCRCEVIASQTEDPVINEQAEGRLYRPGQKHSVQRWRLISEDTIDDEVHQKDIEKRVRLAKTYKDAA